MKIRVNAILTTLVGGQPVTTDSSEAAMSKLLDENMLLNANLPQATGKNLSKKELYDKNVQVKSDRIYELLPKLREEMGEEIEVAKASLNRIMAKGKGITKEYLRVCEILIGDAESILLDPKSKSRFVQLNFNNEIVM